MSANPCSRIEANWFSNSSFNSSEPLVEPTIRPNLFAQSAIADTANYKLSWGQSSLQLDPAPAERPQPLNQPVPVQPPAFAPQGDFNRDGYSDLLLHDEATGQVRIELMAGVSVIGSVALPTRSDLAWRIQGTGDFNQDGAIDLLWRREGTGAMQVWALNGMTLASEITLPSLQDFAWEIQGIGDFNQDGFADLVLHNSSTANNGLWLMNGGSIASVVGLPPTPNLNIRAVDDWTGDGQLDMILRNEQSGEDWLWVMRGTTVQQTVELPAVKGWAISGSGDFNADTQADLILRNSTTGGYGIWYMNGKSIIGVAALPPMPGAGWQVAFQESVGAVPRGAAAPAPEAATANAIAALMSNLSFSGREGDTGQFQIRLNQAPANPTTLTFNTGSFLVIDADGNLQNGTQTTITFTPQNWNQAQTVWFIAEVDGSAAHRTTGNTISYTLAANGQTLGSSSYDLGTIVSTSAPDRTRFNIELDFRYDPYGFWTPQRRTIALKAANDWASLIANEWGDLFLDTSIMRLEADGSRSYGFTTRRYVDDVLVFTSAYPDGLGGDTARGGPDYEFGGWVTSSTPMPRVGHLAVNSSLYTSDSDLYGVIAHELGHVLGLVGLNWTAYNLLERSNPATATFQGAYAFAANGNQYIPLQSQDGPNPVTGVYDYWHPADRVMSLMSYAYTYSLSAPTPIDRAMLADSGYLVYGVNA